MNGKVLKRLKRMLLRVMRKSLGSFGRRLLGNNLGIPRALLRTAALSLALYGGVTLLLPGRALAGDWNYDPTTPVPSPGTYYTILDFDGGDTLEVPIGGTVTLGGSAPFAIFDVDGNPVDRSAIKHFRVFAGTSSSGNLYIANNTNPESWTVQDDGTLFSNLGSNYTFSITSQGGASTLAIGVTTAGGAVTTIMDAVQVGGGPSGASGSTDGFGGVLTINSGGNRFHKNVTLGGNAYSSTGDTGIGGDATFAINGGANRFYTVNIGGKGYGDGWWGKGGEGTATIAGGVNRFDSNAMIGGAGGDAAVNSSDDGGDGGVGSLTISGGQNYFSFLAVGGTGGRGDSAYMSYASGGVGGDGALTITGGKTVFSSTVNVGGTGGYGDIYGARGNGTMEISGGGVFLNDNTINVGGSSGSFELGADATLHTSRSPSISATTVTLSGTLAFDLRDSGNAALRLQNMTNFTGGTAIDILAFSGDSRKTLISMSDSFDFDSYTTASALTVAGTDISRTRAAGAYLYQQTLSPTRSLDLVGGPEVGAIYWEGTEDGNWDVVTANWDTSDVVGKEDDGRFLPGDAVYFGTPGRVQNGTVTIVPDRVTVDEMIIAGGDWVFRGGDIVGGMTIEGGASAGFDTRVHQDKIGALGFDMGAGDYLADIEVKVDAITGETLTLSSGDAGIEVYGARLTLGSDGGTIVLANNMFGVYGHADYPGFAVYTGGLELAGGATRFVNNSVGATGTLNRIVISDGENNFVNNGNTTDGVGALRAVQSDIWDADPARGASGGVEILGGTNTFVGNAAGTSTGPSPAPLDGGAIYAEKNVHITGGVNTFRNNVATGKGGAIYAAGSAKIIAADGDMIFRGNRDSGGANAIFFAGDWDSSIAIGAGAGNTIHFYDPIESESGTVFPPAAIYVGSATETGTVWFDANSSTVRTSFYINGGTVKMTGGAAFDDTDVTNALFSLGGSATLLADTNGNAIAFNRIGFYANSTLKMDMAGAVDKDEADATTNLVLTSYSTGSIDSDATPFKVDAINVTGLDGTYLLIDAGTTYSFAGKYTGLINGGTASGGARTGLMTFDDSEAGKLYLTTGGADIARTATWTGEAGDNVWNGTSDNWSLNDVDPNNPLDPSWKIFKNSDWVTFENSASVLNTIEVNAGGTSTAVIVQGMKVYGNKNWTFTGDDIVGADAGADFTMFGTGQVEFQNATKFGKYELYAGTVKVGAGCTLDGDFQFWNGGTKLDAGYGTEITGALTLNNGSTLAVDMTDATTTGSGLTADSIDLSLGTITVTVTNFSGVDAGSYTVVEDAAGLFNFEGIFNGTINGSTGLPISGEPNDRYGTVDFDASNQGRLDIVTTGVDITRLATWDGGSGTWSEAVQGWSLDGGSTSKYFMSGDDVAFGGAGAGDNAIVVDGYGTATSVGVGAMTVGGDQDWTFSGDDITGTGDFTMSGTGAVLFRNDTSFGNYNIDSGTLKTAAAAELDGNVALGGNATLQADYGTTVDGGLALADGSTVKVDMAAAAATGAALTVDSASMAAGDTFNLSLTGVGASNGRYAVIVDGSGSFNFTDSFVGTINGQSAPIVTPPNDRYGKTDFNTATTGTLAVEVTGADLARTATYSGADGAWSEDSANWNLDGSSSNHFKNGDTAVFNTAGGDQIVVTPTSPSSTTYVSGMTVAGGGDWTFTGGSLNGEALAGEQVFGDGKLVVTGAGTSATFENIIDFKGGIEIDLASNTLTLGYSGVSPLTNDNDISGDGKLVKDGDGELVLAGSNTYNGGSEIVAGTLTAQSADALGTGAVTTSNDGLLKLDFKGEFDNDILGTGKVAAVGDGVVINKTTNVAMTVTGTLSGESTYQSLVVKNGGTLSPGNSPGTITSNNGATFESGSTYEYEIDVNDTTNHDLLAVTAGDVVIESGARLDVVFLDGSTPVTGAGEVAEAGVEADDRFQVIAAAESQFASDTLFSITDTWSTRFTQSIESDGYYINWIYVAPEFGESVTGYAGPNAQSAADAMDNILGLGLEGKIDGLYSALANMPANDPAALAAAFDQLHGEAYASSREVSLLLQRRFVRMLPGIMERTDEYEAQSSGKGYASLNGRADPFRLWASVDGDWFRRDNTSSHSGYRVNTYGVSVGGDYLFGESAFGGFAFGYDDARVKFKRLSAKDDIDAFHFALYGGLRFRDWYVNAYAGYTNNRHEMRRHIGFAGYGQSARGKYNDDLFSTGFEVGRRLWLGMAELTPSLGLDYMYLDSPGITEKNANDANLRVRSGDNDSLQLRVGARLNRDFVAGCVKWTPEVRAYYTAELADKSATVRSSFNAVPGVAFRSRSDDWGRHGGQFGAGLKADVNNKFDVRMDYDFQVRKHANAHTLSFTAGVNF